MNSFLCTAFAVLCLLPSAARAQSVTVLAHLGGNPNGYFPQTPLVKGADGTLYGTTTQGGAPNWGTVYKVSTAGKVTTIHTFPGGNGGAAPMAGLVFGKDGNLYGTTTKGGTAGNGTVFRVTTAGSATVLHSFSALKYGTYGPNVDGGYPEGGLLLGADGNFYGTTTRGGANDSGDGTVFKMTPSGTLTTIHSFSGSSVNDIYAPAAALVEDKDGNFYGIAGGGSDNYAGAVIKMTPAGVVTVLHTFTGGTSDGGGSGGLVLSKDGNLYGLTSYGGANSNGTAFMVTPAGKFTTLHPFALKTDGAYPAGTLIQGTGTDTNFYGVTNNGGPANGSPYYGYGTIFKMTPAGATSVVYTFNYTAGNSNGTNANGAAPMAGVVLGSDGDFYGTTGYGGKGNDATGLTGYGTIFKLTPAGALTTLFEGVGGGTECHARLVESPEGNFYGTTYGGGASGIGTIFGVTPTGQLVTEYSFDDGVTGAYPNGGMTTDGKGNFFGFTGIDGPEGWGCLYEASEVAETPAAGSAGGAGSAEFVDPVPVTVTRKKNKKPEKKSNDSGQENQAHSDDDDDDHSHHMTYSRKRGGDTDSDNDDGDVEEDDESDPDDSNSALRAAADTFPTVRYTFSGGDDGGEPLGAVYVDASNNVFGTTTLGGTHGEGTVFELTSGNVLKTLYDFQGKGDGAFPAAGLVKGTDGNFYGTTAYASYDSTMGSSTGYGTVFKITPAGVLTTLHTFKSDPDGAVPMAELILGKDSNFYGTTSEGGANLSGTVFKMTPAGTVTILYGFSQMDGDDSGPSAALIQAKDGNLYGTTSSSVFRVNTVPPVISSPATATATVGKAFSYQITASNRPTKFGVGGLFKGITVNPETGLISGTPTAAGKHTLTLQAQNAFGTGTKTLTLTVTN